MCTEMTCPYHGPANRAAMIETRFSNAVQTSGATVVDVQAQGDQAVRYLLAFPSARQRELFISRLVRLDEVEEAEWERYGDAGLELITPTH